MGGTLLGGTQVGYPPARSGWGVPCQGGYPVGGYPVRTTEGVLNTRQAVCLLRSRRRTFLFIIISVYGRGEIDNISKLFR